MWLPPISTTSVASISVRDDATLAEPLVPAPTWLAIGDSITQGFSVSCPTETWVHRLQPHYGPAWNLGIGGCLIEPDAFTWALHEQPWQRICIGLGSNHAWRDSTLADVADRTETLVHAALATDCPHIAWILPPWKPLEVGQGPSHYMHVPLDQDVARRLTSIRETIRHTLAPYAPRMSILEDLTVKNDRLYPDGLHPTGHATAAVAENILKQWAP
jgi:lysophospholipase L1-like esterase